MQTPAPTSPLIRTPGARLLRRAMEARGLTQADVAKSVVCSQQTVSGWLAEKFVPTSPVQLSRLEELFGIPTRAWLTAAQRRDLSRATRAA